LNVIKEQNMNRRYSVKFGQRIICSMAARGIYCIVFTGIYEKVVEKLFSTSNGQEMIYISFISSEEIKQKDNRNLMERHEIPIQRD